MNIFFILLYLIAPVYLYFAIREIIILAKESIVEMKLNYYWDHDIAKFHKLRKQNENSKRTI